MEKTKHINIAIDGPSGSGKSTVAKGVAKELGIVYVDTGALYRSIGLHALRTGTNPKDEEAMKKLLQNLSVELTYIDGEQAVLLNGENVSGLIRTPEVASYASSVSAIPLVRSFLLETQKKIAREESVVMDGRDIGTVILPDADVKIFLISDDRERAKRRTKELLEKGENVTFEEVYESMKARDRQDSTRAVAPAIRAEDAVPLDNTYLGIEATLEKVLEIIKNKIGE